MTLLLQMTVPIHYNPSAWGVSDPVPWDKAVCGAAPNFEVERTETVKNQSRTVTVYGDETTGYQQSSDQSKVTCEKCKEALHLLSNAAMVQVSFGWM